MHKVGDLLIISDFSNGGTTSSITIYEWNPANADTNGTLKFLAGGDTTTAKCGGSTNDPFCGIVNPTSGTVSPWPFTDKAGNTTFLNGEFFEGEGQPVAAAGRDRERVLRESSRDAASTSPTAARRTSSSATGTATPACDAGVERIGPVRDAGSRHGDGYGQQSDKEP